MYDDDPRVLLTKTKINDSADKLVLWATIYIAQSLSMFWYFSSKLLTTRLSRPLYWERLHKIPHTHGVFLRVLPRSVASSRVKIFTSSSQLPIHQHYINISAGGLWKKNYKFWNCTYNFVIKINPTRISAPFGICVHHIDIIAI